MNLLPFEYDEAFVKCMAGVTSIVNEAQRKAFFRWSTVFDRSIHNPLTRMGQHYNQTSYEFELITLFIGGKNRRCLYISHYSNGQKCFIQMDDFPKFDLHPFLNGRIPREESLNHYTFVMNGKRNAWLYDPKEQFLEDARAGN